MGDHDGLESVITIGWNTQSDAAHAVLSDRADSVDLEAGVQAAHASVFL